MTLSEAERQQMLKEIRENAGLDEWEKEEPKYIAKLKWILEGQRKKESYPGAIIDMERYIAWFEGNPEDISYFELTDISERLIKAEVIPDSTFNRISEEAIKEFGPPTAPEVENAEGGVLGRIAKIISLPKRKR